MGDAGVSTATVAPAISTRSSDASRCCLRLQPNYIHLSMNSGIAGSWRVGRWQNLVSAGEMMRVMTDFRRMRFGLGVTLMTDSYFGESQTIGLAAFAH